ncbi:unnamed protein product [Lepeophtheirus salmonis]|uniref:(salmon louse) hypothetical protein n=1 Tax=Lepeophtheirus salmonis TaxID=72036 RepID=A0A7R8H2P4_LEPSM|nr:unnamed protein product [Lepeophtheirus salmonis]CAF2827612.1 unnamed protein product [Lepeophtheirus salmonis]
MDRSLKRSYRIPRIDPPPPSSIHNQYNNNNRSIHRRRKSISPILHQGVSMDNSRSMRRMSASSSSQPKNRNGAGHFYLKVAVHNRLLKKPNYPHALSRPLLLHLHPAQNHLALRGFIVSQKLLHKPRKKTDLRRESYRNRQRYYPARPAAADIEWAIDVARSHWMQEIGPPPEQSSPPSLNHEQELAFAKKKPAFWTRLLLLLSLRNQRTHPIHSSSDNENNINPHICVSTVEGRCEVCDILMI